MKRKGFTLIELLIVVAIIAILAAIAIPNFLAAQTRAKVSRVHEEMRGMATGLESYFVDNNGYPTDNGSGVVYRLPSSGYTGLTVLSTPIAYITKLPTDYFRVGNPYWPDPDNQTYVYYCDEKDVPASWWNSPAAWNYSMFSFGPDKISSWAMEYDATNGIVSNGDIRRFGPARGIGR
jgi:type II secretion system protein G